MSLSRPTSAPTSGGPALARLQGASKHYDDTVALHPTDLEIQAGEVVAILGPNGAGKTTTVHLLLGLIRATSGRCELFGHQPGSWAARSRIGAMLQTARVPDVLTVREHLELVAAGYADHAPLEDVVASAGLEGLEDRRFGLLSGGQQQRLLFALSLVGVPELLFLDEPTVGLDPEARKSFWAVLRERVAAGTSIVLTTHYLEEAEALADRIIILAEGRVIADGPRDAIVSRARRRKVRARTRLSLDELRVLPGVTSVVAHRDRVQLDVADPAEDTIRAFLARDPDLRELEVERGGLEEALDALLAERSENDEVAA